jgi:hypothetical protein
MRDVGSRGRGSSAMKRQLPTVGTPFSRANHDAVNLLEVNAPDANNYKMIGI